MSYDTSGFEPSVSVNPANFENLNNWKAYYWRNEFIKIDDRVGDLKLDFRQNMDVDEAATIVWTLTSPEVNRLLRDVRGWSSQRYQQWLSTTLLRVLLP